MNTLHKKILRLLALVQVGIVPLFTFAQVITPTGTTITPTGTTLSNPLNATTLTGLLSEILSYVQQIGAIFLTLMLIYVGFKFVAARGNEEKLQGARSALLWTVIGGLILLGASAIATAIATTGQSL